MVYRITSYFSQQLFHSLIFRIQLLLTAKKGTPTFPPRPFKSNRLTLFVIFIAVRLVKEQILKAYFWLGIWPWSSKIAGITFEVSSKICLVCSLCKGTCSAISSGLHLRMTESPEARFNSLVHCLGLWNLQFRLSLACCRCPRHEDQNQLLEQNIALFFP